VSLFCRPVLSENARAPPSPRLSGAAAKARGSHLRVHFKHVREVAHAIKDMKLSKAKAFLSDVLQYKRAVPITRWVGSYSRDERERLMTRRVDGHVIGGILGTRSSSRFKGGVGRHAQAKHFKTPGDQCAWPQKASKIVLDLLTNAESNAEVCLTAAGW
jgi:large subunit ribosomal protein L17e